MQTFARTRRALAAVAVAACAATATASAGVDQYTVQRTTTGDAAALAATLKRADVGSATGWTGGPEKPDLSADPGCPNFHPKQSDLVVTGAAAATYKNVGLQMHSETHVMRTPKMVQLDWQRSAQSPNFLSCARRLLAKTSTKSARFLSIRKLKIPRIASYTAAYRALVGVKTPKGTVRLAYDVVLVGHGRTEITLTTTMPASVATTVWIMELGIAGSLAGRAPA
jgi:hypothetical protein